MSAHTPGPWRFIAPGEATTFPCVQRGQSGGFVVADTDADRACADARLIAAAPTLADALFNLLVALGQHEQPADVIAACEAASAALIKSGRVMG